MAKMNVSIHVINKISSSAHETKIIDDYLKRIPWNIKIHQLELKNKLPVEKQKEMEGNLLLNSVSSKDYIISLDERGNQYNSLEFCKMINELNQPISFFIGGAFGLSDAVKSKSSMLLSLGKLTLPHVFARMLLVEQLYRAYTISENHPYHK